MPANNLEKLLYVLTQPAQDIENAGQQLMVYRFVDSAVGVQLDVLGRLVGQPRGGLDDDTYRRYIRARIAANKSEGQFEDIINVTDLVVYEDEAYIVVTNEGTATVRLFVTDIAITDALGAVIHAFALDTKSAGVRIVTQWAQSAPANVFQFDDGPGFNQGALASSLG